MWYEILPSFGVIFGCMTLGMASGKWFMAAMHEKPFMKDLCCQSNCEHYLRDQRISGDPYVPFGLEAIPDEPPKKASS
jgi:hypothetical protein